MFHRVRRTPRLIDVGPVERLIQADGDVWYYAGAVENPSGYQPIIDNTVVSGPVWFWSPVGNTVIRVLPVLDNALGDIAASAKTPPFTPYTSYADALAAPKPATLQSFSWITNARLYTVIREAGGPCMGGGWSPANEVWVDHFGPNLLPLGTDMYPAAQAAINYLNAKGGGQLVWGSEQYRISQPLVYPKDSNVRNYSDGFCKSAVTGSADVKEAACEIWLIGPAAPYMIDWRGAEFVNVYNDLGKTLTFEGITLNANNTAPVMFNTPNTDYLALDRCRLVGAVRAVHRVYTGQENSLTLSGGLFLRDCSLTGDIYCDGDTQNWIEGCWFAGGVVGKNYWITLRRCNKINVTNSEFNSASGMTAIFRLEDDNASNLACQDLTLTDLKIAISHAECGVMSDARTHPASRRLHFSAVVAGIGVPTLPNTWHNSEDNIVQIVQGALGSELYATRIYGSHKPINRVVNVVQNGAFYEANTDAEVGVIVTPSLSLAPGARVSLFVRNPDFGSLTRTIAQVRSFTGAGRATITQARRGTGAFELYLENTHPSDTVIGVVYVNFHTVS